MLAHSIAQKFSHRACARITDGQEVGVWQPLDIEGRFLSQFGDIPAVCTRSED